MFSVTFIIMMSFVIEIMLCNVSTQWFELQEMFNTKPRVTLTAVMFTECVDGWYGDNCTQTCGNCFSSACDKVNGSCGSCKKGFKLPLCTGLLMSLSDRTLERERDFGINKHFHNTNSSISVNEAERFEGKVKYIAANYANDSVIKHYCTVAIFRLLITCVRWWCGSNSVRISKLLHGR